MTRFCAVFGCSNRSNRDIGKQFFGFPGVRDNRGRDIPEGIKRRELWVKAIRRADLTPQKIRFASVCSDHFLTGRPADLGDVLNPDYVPTQKLGYISCTKLTTGASSRHSRAKKRLLEKYCEVEENTDIEYEIVEANTGVPELIQAFDKVQITRQTQTEVVDEDILLHQELYDLRNFKDNSTFKRGTFINDNRKTLYFSGIPTYNALNDIFTKLIEPYITVTPQNVIQDKFTHFLITIMKLRLNVDFTLLAYLFGVSVQTISRIFYCTLNVLFYRLKKFIIWPSREQLIASMPMCFKEAFGNKICVIIDCFEIRMEKSRNLQVQSTTWSTYKHHNTIKVLIGITPQGSVSFISQGYGGRISDKALTEDCSILENLIPGDVVLADRGFLIEEAVGLHMATVITSPFLKGKKQLDPKDIEHTRNIASVRIHVERVIGVVRQKYNILYDIIPIFLAKRKTEDTAVIDQILTTCCALVNLCPPIISDD